MVYSVIYYASDAIGRALAWLIIKLAEAMERRRPPGEEAPERPRPRWGIAVSSTPVGREMVWVPRATRLYVSVPDPAGVLSPSDYARAVGAPLTEEKPGVRLFFTFAEAASPDWFKEIERLAGRAERRAARRRRVRLAPGGGAGGRS